MNVIGVIPVRMGASRFPGKPMKKMHGMPMIGHCYHRTRLAPGIQATYVATCDAEIADYVSSIGGKSIMTSDRHTRATTRTAEALEIIERHTGRRVDVVVMVQGDEPLIPPETISETLQCFNDSTVEISNVMCRFRTREAFEDKNNVKIVVDQNNNALYFSREPIPSPWKGWEHMSCYMQTGIIAFRRDTLLNFNAMDETSLEKVESIDMNRVLETGGSIRMVPTDVITIGVDTREELRAAEALLANDPVMKSYLDT